MLLSSRGVSTPVDVLKSHGVEVFKATVYRGSSVYRPGDTVRGALRITLTRPLEAEAVELVASGTAHCEFQYRNDEIRTSLEHNAFTNRTELTYRSSPRTTSHSQDQSFYNHSWTKWKASNGEMLPAGEHVFQFQYVLPTNSPPTFQGRRGYVEHLIRATVVGKTQLKTLRFRGSIIVKPLEFIISWIHDPMVEGKCYWLPSGFLWWRKTGQVSVWTELPKTGYIPGEEVQVKVTIINRSSFTLRGIKIRLVEEVTYKDRKGSDAYKTDETVRCEVEDPSLSVASDVQNTWTGILKIPLEVTSSMLTECIQVWNVIRVVTNGTQEVEGPIIQISDVPT